MVVTLGIYYLLPWVRWDRGPNLPDQAFLLDFANQRLFFGPIEIWAQEFYYITGVLVLAALGLFLVTAVAGRMWCGYACPQTVWTDLMVDGRALLAGRPQRAPAPRRVPVDAREDLEEGRHARHLAADRARHRRRLRLLFPRCADAVAASCGRARPRSSPTRSSASSPATTYMLGGIAREQVCNYMCPWPRIQAAMFDAESLLVSYRDYRGEPRGPHKKGQTVGQAAATASTARPASRYARRASTSATARRWSASSARCASMPATTSWPSSDRPRGLIAYDTFRNLSVSSEEQRVPVRLVRPRTVLYTALIALVIGIMGWAFAMRVRRRDQPHRGPQSAVREAVRRRRAQRLYA